MLDEKSILIAEDNTIIAMVMEKDLQAAGYAVVGIVGRVDRGLKVADSQTIDLALIDIDLQSGDSGVDLAAALKERHDVPSVFVSGQESIACSHRDAAFGLIPKPFKSIQLVDAVRAAFDYLGTGKEPDDKVALRLF